MQDLATRAFCGTAVLAPQPAMQPAVSRLACNVHAWQAGLSRNWRKGRRNGCTGTPGRRQPVVRRHPHRLAPASLSSISQHLPTISPPSARTPPPLSPAAPRSPATSCRRALWTATRRVACPDRPALRKRASRSLHARRCSSPVRPCTSPAARAVRASVCLPFCSRARAHARARAHVRGRPPRPPSEHAQVSARARPFPRVPCTPRPALPTRLAIAQRATPCTPSHLCPRLRTRPRPHQLPHPRPTRHLPPSPLPSLVPVSRPSWQHVPSWQRRGPHCVYL